MVTALIENGGFVGHSEGHAFALFSSINDATHGYLQDMTARGLRAEAANAVHYFDEYKSMQLIAAHAKKFAALLHGGARWLDKTPSVEGIWCLPDMLQIWPEARVICMLRSAVGNTKSAERYFRVSFVDACANWSNCLAAWDEVKPMLPANATLEIEHDSFIRSPEEISSDIAKFLQLTDEQTASFQARVTEDVRSWIGTRGGTEPGLESLTEEEAAVLAGICGRQMLKRDECDEVWLREAQQATVNRSLIPIDSVKAYFLQDETLFETHANGFMIHPGASMPTICGVPSIRIGSYTEFACQCSVDNSQANSVHFSVEIRDIASGHVLANRSLIVDGGGSRELVISLPAAQPADGGRAVGLLFQTAMADQSAVNHYAWAQMSGLEFRQSALDSAISECGTRQV